MPYESFHSQFPEIAVKGTRTITAINHEVIPTGNYVSRIKRHYRIFKDAVNPGKDQENDELTGEDSSRAEAGDKTIRQPKKTRRGRRVRRKR
ncbi:MAG TPA: hypothetical protein VFZ76_07935 [Anaerolineales bacterium]